MACPCIYTLYEYATRSEFRSTIELLIAPAFPNRMAKMKLVQYVKKKSRNGIPLFFFDSPFFKVLDFMIPFMHMLDSCHSRLSVKSLQGKKGKPSKGLFFEPRLFKLPNQFRVC